MYAVQPQNLGASHLLCFYLACDGACIVTAAFCEACAAFDCTDIFILNQDLNRVDALCIVCSNRSGDDNEFVGFISRRRILEFNKKQVILVDHNEVSQAVEGLEECEIMEIIDHHRIGSVETVSPVYFRNQPVGCTGTIVAQMYRELGIEITKEMAGLMCSAILSDTLMFRSPTCTALDHLVAEKLASIAHIDIEQYARDMFDAGSNLREKSAKEIFYQDFKKFNDSNINFGVGQISSMNKEELSACKGKLLPYMEEVRTSYGLDMVFFMMTDIINESTELLMVGEMCKEVIENAFETTVEDSSAELPGVVSRKKQLIPAILGQLS